jgi:hypothetical protein
MLISSKVSLSLFHKGDRLHPAGALLTKLNYNLRRVRMPSNSTQCSLLFFPLLSCILMVVLAKSSGCSRNHLSILGYSASCGIVLKVCSIMICGEESVGLKLNGTAI